MIYFAQAITGGPVKIGCTANVDSRLGQLESHYGTPLALLATFDGGRAEERAWHERFSHLRLGRTEQFRPAPELMEAIGRPLLVSADPDAVEIMEGLVTLASFKGTPEYAAWLDGLNKKTHIPKAMLFRLAMAEYARANGYTAPPER